MMDRWWASRGAAETVALLMDRSDDPSMLVGTGFLVLHAIGADAIEQQAGPFGDRSISKALDGIGDDPLIGAVCLAFDYASGIPGYGATRVAQLKAEADAGARAVYGSLVLQGPVELALKRAADTYGIAPSTVPTISKSLVSADFASESAADRALHARAALIADAESSEVSKLTRDTFEVKGHRRTQNRDSSGRFADTEGGRKPMTLQEKQRLRQERLGRYMQGARRRKEDAPERTADRERTVSRTQETVAEQAVQEQEQEQAEQEQAVHSEEEAARQRRRKKMVAARRAAAAAGSRRMAAGASSAGRYDAEIQGQARLEAARDKQQVVAQRIANKEKVRAAEQEKQEHHLAEVNAEKAKVLHTQQEEYRKNAKQVEAVKRNFATFNPSKPNATTVSTAIELGKYGTYNVPVPLALMEDVRGPVGVYEGKDEQSDAAISASGRMADPKQVINLYAGMHSLDKEPDDETMKRAAETARIVLAAKSRGLDMAGLVADYTRRSGSDPMYLETMDNVRALLGEYMFSNYEDEANLRREFSAPGDDEDGNTRSAGELVSALSDEMSVFVHGVDMIAPVSRPASGVQKVGFAETVLEAREHALEAPPLGRTAQSVKSLDAFIRAGQISALTSSGESQDAGGTRLVWTPLTRGTVVVSRYDEYGDVHKNPVSYTVSPPFNDLDDDVESILDGDEPAAITFVPDRGLVPSSLFSADDSTPTNRYKTGFDKEGFLATFTPNNKWPQAVPLLPRGITDAKASPGTAGGAHRVEERDSPHSGAVYGDEQVRVVHGFYNNYITANRTAHYGIEDANFYYELKNELDARLDEWLESQKPEGG